MNYGMVPTMELEEAMRWCFRHCVCVDFYGDGERKTFMRIATPLRGDTRCDVVEAQVPHHDATGETFVEVITAIRERLGYE